MDDPASFFEQKAQELKKQKKFEEALLYSDKAQKIHHEEKSPDFWYKKGQHFVEVGEFEKAIDCFDNDLSKRHQSYETFFLKGKILFQLEKYEDALECFNKAAEERNQSYLHSNKKSEHLKKARKYEKALLYNDLASNEISLTAEFWYYKGLSLLYLKKYSDAHLCISNALGLDENNPQFLYDLAKCELFLGNDDKSIDALKKSVTKKPVIKEKLQVDADFKSLLQNSRFRALIHL